MGCSGLTFTNAKDIPVTKTYHRCFLGCSTNMRVAPFVIAILGAGVILLLA